MAQEPADTALKSVATALEILELVVMSPAELGVSEIAVHLGVAKGGVHRHLQTLVSRGYLWQNPQTSRYRAGIQCHLLGRMAAESVTLLSAAEQPMRQLRDTFGLTVTLATPRGSKVLIIERLFGTTPLEIGVRPGSEFELHATSQGKVFLAFGKPSLWKTLEGRKLPAPTEHAITNVADLAQQCEKIQSQGWAMAAEESAIGINAISAPVFDAKGACIAALTMVASIQNLPRKPAKDMVARLQEAANAVSTQLGFRA